MPERIKYVPSQSCTSQKLYTLLILLTLTPTPMYACGACVFAMVWQYLPAVFWWTLIFILWYLGLALINTIHKERAPGSYGIITSVLIVIMAGFIATVSFGPLLLLPFGLLALTTWIRAAYTNHGQQLPLQMRKQIQALGIAVVIATVATGIYEGVAMSKMSDTDIILKWEDTHVTERLMERLNKNKTASIPKFRTLLREGKSFAVEAAALSLAELPTAKQDIPLMLEALERIEKSKPYLNMKIEQALVKASGLDIPPNTSAEVWREKLQEAGLLKPS